VSLDFPYAHAPGIKRDNYIVEALPVGLIFFYQLRLKAAVAVMGDGDRQRAVLPFQGLFTRAVPGITVGIDHFAVLFVSQMVGHLGL
jgi:hypothetical protein